MSSPQQFVELLSAQAAREFGASLAAKCKPGQVLAFQGPLGAGKTEVIRGLAAGLGCTDEVTSPTYTLVHEYQSGGQFPLYHLDLYRLESQKEAKDPMLHAYLPSVDGITALEWPERAEALLPPGTIWYQLEVSAPDRRRVTWRVL